ncbi:MAG: hypothetical protein FD167_5922 [bacterium]|nr:MAG: hypothetical protein FD167_5922 [bacterium]
MSKANKEFYCKNYKVYDYTLTTLSPVHIGTGEEILPIEYYLDIPNQRVIIPDWEQMLSDNENLDGEVFRQH